MVLSAHQPAYLPWLGYFHKVASCDRFVILDKVQFEKNSFTNRNYIAGPNSKILLTVPVSQTGHMSKWISDLKIANESNWQKKHWKSIQGSYSKAPCFDAVGGILEPFYQKEWESLVDFTTEMLKTFLKYLDISTTVQLQSELAITGVKQELILNLCRRVGASQYVFGSLGRDYAEEKFFDAAGIQIHFQDYKHPVYPQMSKGEFEPYLSVVDLLMNVKASDAKKIILMGNVRSYEEQR